MRSRCCSRRTQTNCDPLMQICRQALPDRDGAARRPWAPTQRRSLVREENRWWQLRQSRLSFRRSIFHIPNLLRYRRRDLLFLSVCAKTLGCALKHTAVQGFPCIQLTTLAEGWAVHKACTDAGPFVYVVQSSFPAI